MVEVGLRHLGGLAAAGVAADDGDAVGEDGGDAVLAHLERRQLPPLRQHLLVVLLPFTLGGHLLVPPMPALLFLPVSRPVCGPVVVGGVLMPHEPLIVIVVVDLGDVLERRRNVEQRLALGRVGAQRDSSDVTSVVRLLVALRFPRQLAFAPCPAQGLELAELRELHTCVQRRQLLRCLLVRRCSMPHQVAKHDAAHARQRDARVEHRRVRGALRCHLELQPPRVQPQRRLETPLRVVRADVQTLCT
mmetsp:Transcript_63709/g.132655  ORF Transcript_63709/g.132655 Transcript_63709/m.132655 type:complete len:247 (-) Transcript_63709:40-780(-)